MVPSSSLMSHPLILRTSRHLALTDTAGIDGWSVCGFAMHTAIQATDKNKHEHRSMALGRIFPVESKRTASSVIISNMTLRAAGDAAP